MPAVTTVTPSGKDHPRISVLDTVSVVSDLWAMSAEVLEAGKTLVPVEEDTSMVSIPQSSQGFDIPYSAGGGSRNSYDESISSNDTPTSPNSSWEESLQLLSKNLQVICCSPDRYDCPNVPQSPVSPAGGGTSSGPRSPVALTHPTSSPRGSPCPASPTDLLRADMKLLQVRHVQSEERLREKLTSICRSPRHLRTMYSEPERSSPLMHSYRSRSPSKLAAVSAKRKSLTGAFRRNIDIGKLGVEDINVLIEDKKLKVSPKDPEAEIAQCCELPAVVEIPPDVDLAKLICVVRDGVLEVRESKNRGPPKGRFLHGLDLRRSLSMGGSHIHRACQTQASPIVIEDEGSHKLKLILQVPVGYMFGDIKLKTVDDLLIISGKKNLSSMGLVDSILIATAENAEDVTSNLSSEVNQELFHVFELPSSMDPYSMTAHLTDGNKLIIQADLSSRDRSNTM